MRAQTLASGLWNKVHHNIAGVSSKYMRCVGMCGEAFEIAFYL